MKKNVIIILLAFSVFHCSDNQGSLKENKTDKKPGAHTICFVENRSCGKVPENVCKIANQRQNTEYRPEFENILVPWLETTKMTTEEINCLFPFSRSTCCNGEEFFDVSIEFGVYYNCYDLEKKPENCLVRVQAINREKISGKVSVDSYSE